MGITYTQLTVYWLHGLDKYFTTVCFSIFSCTFNLYDWFLELLFFNWSYIPSSICNTFALHGNNLPYMNCMYVSSVTVSGFWLPYITFFKTLKSLLSWFTVFFLLSLLLFSVFSFLSQFINCQWGCSKERTMPLKTKECLFHCLGVKSP